MGQKKYIEMMMGAVKSGGGDLPECYIEATLNGVTTRRNFNTSAEIPSGTSAFLSTGVSYSYVKFVRSKYFDILSQQNVRSMFGGLYNRNIQLLDVSDVSVDDITDLTSWLSNTSVENIRCYTDLTNVTTLNYMISSNPKLKSLDLSQATTTEETVLAINALITYSSVFSELKMPETPYTISSMTQFVSGCSSLKRIDLSNATIMPSANINEAFNRCTSVTEAWAKTQTDADKLNTSSYKPSNVNFVVKP